MEYIFRVLIDSNNDEGVFRDIAVNASSNFDQLHKGIMEGFNFRGDQMASFYLSDEEWNKGDEIGLMDMSVGESNFRLMHETSLNELIIEKGQKLIYVYDFLNMWCFFVELVDIKEQSNLNNYAIIRSFGEAPHEDSKDVMADLGLIIEDEEDYGFGDFDDSMEYQNIDDFDL